MNDASPQKTRIESTLLEADCRDAIRVLKRSLIEFYESALADRSKPQEVSRRFGINRNLSSKLSRLMAGTNPFVAIKDLPGREAFKLALDSLSRKGGARAAATAATIERCLDAIDLVVAKHADNREQFVLMLESMGLLDTMDHRSTKGRELAFHGNGGIWGVSARTRHSMAFLTPGAADPTRLDYVHVSQVLGFRRLRPNVRWRLLRMLMVHDKGGVMKAAVFPEGLDPAPDPVLPLLVRPFCSPNMPDLETSSTSEGCQYMLAAGPVGKQAQCDIVVGNIARGLPGSRTATDEFGSVSASVTLPVETLLFDLIVHRDLHPRIAPEVLVYGFPHGGADGPTAQTVENLLWKGERLIDLGSGPPEFATPLVPRIEELAAYVFGRMNWAPQDYVGLRLTIPYPPMSSRVVLRWPLPEE